MQNSHKSCWISLGLLLSLNGCSDQTQFTNTPVSSHEAAPTPGQGDAVVNASTFGPETEVPDEAASSQVADTASDPNSVTSGTIGTVTQSAVDQFQQLCSQGSKKTLTQRIKFPETANCRFGQAGNLARKDAYLQAMEAQTTSITLPANAQLCGLSVDSEVSTIQYDDFMILTLNGYVLLSSNKAILQGLEGSGSTAFKWDFNRIRGVPVDFNSPSYCMGSASAICDIPVTDTAGKFQFKVDPTSLINLADQVVDNHQLNFALVATGDNDDADCWHTELNLDFTLQYVETP